MIDPLSEKFRDRYRIDSARLKGFDYGSDGAYFVTINTKNREPYFGKIKNEIMRLSTMGCLAWKCWYEIPNHFPLAILDEFVVMPDHVHGILFIQNNFNPLRRIDAINRVYTTQTNNAGGGITGQHNPMGKKTLGEIVRYYKGRTTFEIHQNILPDFTWQPRFHDRIIRDEGELNRIRQYIKENPKNWEKKDFDQFGPTGFSGFIAGTNRPPNILLTLS